MTDSLLVQRQAVLKSKLDAIEKLVAHLQFSAGRLPYPLARLEGLGPERMESVSALIERFGKLQDLLGGVFREIDLLSGGNNTDMNRVLLSMEKLGVLASAERWRTLRLLRNQGSHDYDPDDAGRTRFVNALAQAAPELIEIARATRLHGESLTGSA